MMMGQSWCNNTHCGRDRERERVSERERERERVSESCGMKSALWMTSKGKYCKTLLLQN